MRTWKDLLQPLPAKLSKGTTVEVALATLLAENQSFAFIYVEEEIVGYVDTHFLAMQLADCKNMQERIQYKVNILKVPCSSSVEFYHNIEVFLIVDEQGKAIGYSTLSTLRHYITELKLQQMNESIDSAEIGIITTDQSYGITFLNERAEAILGLSRSCLLGRNYYSLLEIDEDLQEVLKGKRLIGVTTRFNFKEMNGHFSPVFQEEHIVGIVHIFSLQAQKIHRASQLGFSEQESEEMQALYSSVDSFLEEEEREGRRLIYRSDIMKQLVEEVKNIASVDSTILLHGESGVGKEVFARKIHALSKRKDQPFVSVNCGAIPENLLESELFGYEKGAFTGAQERKTGLFELANEGTLLLDEVTELPLHMQVKLLRVLQEREVVRVGGTKTIPINVRIIAASNRDLQELVDDEQFREDLYYRLNVVPITIPPLRERKEDVIPLAVYFLKNLNKAYERDKILSREALQLLTRHDWQGNVRQLQNVIERLVVTTKQTIIQQQDVFDILYRPRQKEQKPKLMIQGIMPLKEATEELEGQLIKLAMQRYKTAVKVAEVLEVSQSTISRRIHKLLK